MLGYPKPENITPARVKNFAAGLPDRLAAFREERGLDLGELANMLDCSRTAVSKYLNKKPEGDVEKLEGIIEDVLKNAERQKLIHIQLFETSVSRIIAAAIATARKTNDFSLVTGNAGIGKTKGVEFYVKQNPACVLITAASWARNAGDLFRALWDAVNTHSYSGKTKKILFLIDRLRGSNRPLIIDNAHRLKPGGIEFIFDFHDATDIPVTFVGNPEILTHLRKSDQLFSRIGEHRHITSLEDSKQCAEKIVETIAPRFADCLDYSQTVVSKPGHLRALRKQLTLAEELATKESFRKDFPEDTNRAAFRVAHSKLIRDYAL